MVTMAEDTSASGEQSLLSMHDEALVRLVGEKDPYGAPHGTKGAAWNAVADALGAAVGHITTGLHCRGRMQWLLERYDFHRAGRRTSKVISKMPPDALEIMEQALMQIAQGRNEKQQKAKELRDAAVHGKEWKGAKAAAGNSPARKTPASSPATGSASPKRARTADAVPVPTDIGESASTTPAPPLAKNDASEETTPASPPVVVNALGKATVPAKRRKRRGVKSLEEKQSRPTVIDEVMRQSREEFVNQLRVQAAAQAAAEERREPVTVTTTAAAVVETSSGKKAKMDMDLSLLQAVKKHQPYACRDRNLQESRWLMVAKRVKSDTMLKFTTGALRDRCEALLADFEAHSRRGSKYVSGVAATDTKRLALLSWVHTARAKHIERSAQDSVDQTMDAIEIDDDEDVVPESPPPSGTESARASSSTAYARKDERSPPPRATAVDTPTLPRKRRRDSVESTDADPAADDPSIAHASQDSIDYAGDDVDPPSAQAEVLLSPNIPAYDASADPSQEATRELDQRAVHHPRSDFQALVGFMQQQLIDHRREWEREHIRRTNEQQQRQREVNAILEMMNKQREDHRAEMMAMVSTINKERDERRNEFMVTMNLITKMVEAKFPSLQEDQ